MPPTAQAIIAALDQQLKRGDKALIGNSAYRRYLRATAKKAFAIDIGKVAEEARYDGLFVLRTNARITPLAGGPALSRPDPGGAALPDRQGADAHAADLPFLGRGDPRSRVLLLSGPDPAQGAG